MQTEDVIMKCLKVYRANSVTPLGDRGPLEIELPKEEVEILRSGADNFPGTVLITPSGSIRVNGVLIKEKSDG